MTGPRERLSQTVTLVASAAGLASLRLIGALAVYAMQVVLARWLGAGGLGEYSFAASLMIILASIAALGLPPAAVRFLPQQLADGDVGGAMRFMAFSRRSVILAGITVSGFGLLVAATGLIDGVRSSATVVALIAVPLFALLLMNSGLAHGLSRHHLSSVPNSSLRPLALLGAVLILWSTGVIGSAGMVMTIHVVIIAVAVASQAVLVNRAARGLGEPISRPDRAQERRWVATAAPLLVASLASSYLAELVVIGGSLRASVEEVAVLNAAIRTGALLLFVMTAIDYVVLPEYSAHHARRDQSSLEETLQRATAVRVVSIAILASVLIVGGQPILSLFGPDFGTGYPALVLVVAGLTLRAAAGGAPELLSATTGANALMVANVGGLAVGAATLVLTPMLSPVTSAALAYAVVTVVVSWTSRFLCQRRLVVDPSVLGLMPRRRQRLSRAG